jgi:threonine dehydrogenase-like Zn-dependent dehydrogenase
MRAALLHDFGDLRVEDIPDPEYGPRDVLIDVRCVQVGVTECMLINGDDVAMHDQLAQRLKVAPVQFGGHEFAGVISAVGSEVTHLQVGQRVTAVETLPCGRCSACARGRTAGCIAPDIIAFNRPGALAERISVPASAVVRIPDSVSFSAAAAVQPLAGAVHAHATLAVQPGESVLVLGGGVMGLLGAAVARHGNAGLIMLSSHSAAKRELGLRFGADQVIDADDDVLAAALEATDGVGFDVVLETAGGSASVGLSGTETIELAVRAVRRVGRIAVVSVLPAHSALPTGLMRERSLTLVHPRSGAGYYAQTTSVFEHSLGLIGRGSVDVEALVTHRLDGLDEVGKAIEITSDKNRFGAINPAQLVLG